MSKKQKQKERIRRVIQRAEGQLEQLRKTLERLEEPDYFKFQIRYELGESGRGTFSGGFKTEKD